MVVLAGCEVGESAVQVGVVADDEGVGGEGDRDPGQSLEKLGEWGSGCGQGGRSAVDDDQLPPAEGHDPAAEESAVVGSGVGQFLDRVAASAEAWREEAEHLRGLVARHRPDRDHRRRSVRRAARPVMYADAATTGTVADQVR